jgi:hypothetical protein
MKAFRQSRPIFDQQLVRLKKKKTARKTTSMRARLSKDFSISSRNRSRLFSKVEEERKGIIREITK